MVEIDIGVGQMKVVRFCRSVKHNAADLSL
jgi:hypothetical protein